MKNRTMLRMAWGMVTVVCVFMESPVFADGTDPYSGGTGGNSVHWNYWSPLSVEETITDIGTGTYRYAYSFTNTDTSPIWDFSIATKFFPYGNVTLFTGHPTMSSAAVLCNKVYNEYDARNLDSAILSLPYTWTTPWVDSGTAIQVGEAASGFSFTASTYDPSPKYFFYETIASGYARQNGTGNVAAVGLTPEPATLSLFVLSTLAGLRRKK